MTDSTISPIAAGRIQVFESARAMQKQALAWRMAGEDVGFVATMGALHAGHASLVARARRENRRTVVSVFVNPLQFDPNEDFERYPRAFERDLTLLTQLGADAVFHPPVSELYPDGFNIRVDPGRFGSVLEGASRPGHFGGVLTVVLKLFNLTQPTRAYFGQKDVQQLLLVRQLVRDLALPIQIVACPTVREPDGLALSSRNSFLDGGQRQMAPAIYQALLAARTAFEQRERDAVQLEKAALARLGQAGEIVVDYVALFDPATFARPERATPGHVLAAAVKLGSTRLIDNVVLGAEYV